MPRDPLVRTVMATVPPPLDLPEPLALVSDALTRQGATRPAASRVLSLLMGEPWAITPDWLPRLVAIAERVSEESIDALETRLGRPLENARSVTLHGSTAVVPITGPLFRRANLFTRISGATSLDILARDIQTAIDDRAVKAIILDIDSPGGQTAGIADLGALIAGSDKPIHAFVDNLAASAGYWLASQARSITISPTAMLGSIGVVLSHRPQADGPLEIVSSVSPLKHATPETQEGRAEWQRIVDHIAAVFVGAVARGRRVDPEAVINNFGRGSLLVGEHALAAGMADRPGTLESLIQSLAGLSGPTVRRLPAMAAHENPGAPLIDRAYLDAQHPDLVAAIRAEGHAAGLSEGRTAGAAAERERILAVRAVALPGHEKLIEALAFDGQTTAPEAAMAVNQAERQLRERAQQSILNAPAAVPAAEQPAADAKAQEQLDKAAKLKAAQAAIMAQVTGQVNGGAQ